jgi:hypothetical protein
MSRSGRKIGGVPISRGHLYWILSNPIYIGRLRHKGQIHDGLHPAIIDLEIWDRVQQKLKSQSPWRGKLLKCRAILCGRKSRRFARTTWWSGGDSNL